ncbi:MAG: MATE family efflux transporter, partial [Lachnospiraceae bacterium]|nr:MATE family efflux transporter [Lachnospiraceae bacterium]
VGTASSFMQMVTFIITSLAMGSTVLIGQHIGEKNPKAAGNAVGTTIILFAVIGVIMTLILEAAAGPIVRILQVPDNAVAKAVLYLRICSGGLLVIITYNVISGILRGIGNANLPFIFVSIACVVNIAADLLLTGLLGMDVAGVAIATVFAQFVSVVISLGIIRRQKMPIKFSLKQCRVYPVELRKILHVGIPIALQETLGQVSFLVINSIVNGMGLMPSAGYGVAQKLVSFIMLIPSSVMQSVSAFVAQNIGAGQKKRAQKGYLTAMGTGVCIGIGVFLIGFLGGSALSSLFTSDAEVIAESTSYLHGFCIDCVFTCVMFSTSGYFNGCGNSVPVMLQGITAAFFVRIPVALFMASLPNTSLFYIGLTTPISTLYGILFYGICFAWMHRTERKK